MRTAMTPQPTLTALATDLAAGRTSSRALVQACLEKIEDPAGEGRTTFLYVDKSAVLAQAEAMDLQSNICSKIRVAELAGVVQLSIGHLFRAFKLCFGASPLAYVMRQRILRAQAIMASSKEPLSQVALDCGMCEQAHFSRTFRRIIGVKQIETQSDCGDGRRNETERIWRSITRGHCEVGGSRCKVRQRLPGVDAAAPGVKDLTGEAKHEQFQQGGI
jgi:AraC family transcriptional regulator